MKILDYEGLKQVITKIKELLDKRVEKDKFFDQETNPGDQGAKWGSGKRSLVNWLSDFDQRTKENRDNLKSKVTAINGKGLSTNDFTNSYKDTVDEMTMKNPPSSDFNAVSKQGIYNGDFSSNCPNGSGKYTLIVCPTDSSTQHRTNYMFQIAIRDNSDSTPYFRQRRGSTTWGKWYKYSTNDYTDAEKNKVKNIPDNPKYTDTTYSLATTSTNGLMSSSDKQKMNNLKEQVILTESQYNALSDSQKNDTSKIYFIKD